MLIPTAEPSTVRRVGPLAAFIVWGCSSEGVALTTDHGAAVNDALSAPPSCLRHPKQRQLQAVSLQPSDTRSLTMRSGALQEWGEFLSAGTCWAPHANSLPQ